MQPAFAPALALRSALRRQPPRRLPPRRALATRPRIRACAPAAPSLTGRKLVVSTPLYYVNAPPHMGSAYTAMAADALVRFYRMAGAHPTLVTGTDEHGEKIAAAAAAAAAAAESPEHPASPQPFCDRVSDQFRHLWRVLQLSPHSFVRTTSHHHQAVVRLFMERVWQNGDIYKSQYQGLYCTGCEEYKDVKDLLPGNVCPTHQTPCPTRHEDNYFFALSKYQHRLQTFLERNPAFVQPPERRNEVLAWVHAGLRDFSVSRANNPWGIPVPRDHSHTIYVWFDALVGYLSALLPHDAAAAAAAAHPPSLDLLHTHGWPAHVHIIGKDILRFHAVYWPAMLMSAGLPLPRTVFGHGFLTKDGMKMGKSLRNVLDPVQLVRAYGTDAVRYYFLKALHFGSDGDFSEQRFVDVVNADLANSFGNLLNRALNLLHRHCAGALPVSAAQLGLPHAPAHERALRLAAEHASQRAYAQYDALDFDGACQTLMAITFEANSYIDRVAPWTKFKSRDAADVQAATTCVVNVLEACRVVAVGLNPVVPQLAQHVYHALGLAHHYDRGLMWHHITWGALTQGMSFAKPKPVFPRLHFAAPEAAELS